MIGSRLLKLLVHSALCTSQKIQELISNLKISLLTTSPRF